VALATGTRLGPYEIVVLLGAGGMGEVYRARDPRLGRDVALKVLLSVRTANAERLIRFEQEARAAASLTHPNILAVHDVGHHDGAPYIVSELLEGTTLRDRLASGALPVRKAIEYGVQIAHGLAAAHEKGIVHRDLKPENIFITSDNRVKILDFGLAKLTERDSALAGASGLPTSPPATVAGLVLGTIGYMAPEQVRGLPVDQRSDIFALGAILHEMLSGRRTFRGETPMDSMTAILKEDPPPLPTAERYIPVALERIVHRCLEKNPAARFQSATDLAFALEGLSTESDSVGAARIAPRRRVWNNAALAWAIALIVLAIAMALGALRLVQRGMPPQPAIRAAILPPTNWSFSAFSLGDVSLAASGLLAVSPNGRRMAIVGTGPDGSRALLLRPIDTASVHALDGTEGAHHPFWSPDSRRIGFFADGKLKIVDPVSGNVRMLCDAPSVSTFSFGGTWSPNGTIVFAAGDRTMLYSVAETGGVPVPVTNASESALRPVHLPFFLPDGRHFLYRRGVATGQGNSAEVLVGTLDSRETVALLTGVSQVIFAQDHLLFVRGTTLMAQPFDARSLRTTGEALTVADQIQVGGGGNAVFSASQNGVLAFRTGGPSGSRLAWFDRSGKAIGDLGEPGDYLNLELSPDGTRAAVSFARTASGTRDIWIYDVARALPVPFTHDASTELVAIWSPDGHQIVFDSNRTGARDVYRSSASGINSQEILKGLLPGVVDPRPLSWSRDGHLLFATFTTSPSGTPQSDLWVLPLAGNGQPFPFLTAPFSETRGRFSPDGRHVVYVSNESGRNEVYVVTFPKADEKTRVSSGGGDWPRWRADGKEIFYVTPDDQLAAAEVRSNSERLEIGAVQSLFKVNPRKNAFSPFDVAGDGQKFLVNTVVEDVSEPIALTVNWLNGLGR